MMTPEELDLGDLAFPCLFLDQEGWKSLSDKLDDPFFAQLHQDNVAALETLLREVPRIGSRPLKSRLQRAVVGWYLTGDERYLELAFSTLELCCEHTELWWFGGDYVEGLRAADLSTGEMLYNVAFGVDALYAYLPVSLKERCLRTLIDEGLRAYLQGVELKDWWVDCDFNWNSALHANAGLAALIVRPIDRALSDKVLGHVLAGLPHMIEAFYPDGGWIEGVMYFNTAIGHLTDFVAPLHRLTGEDLGVLNNVDIQDTITWKLYMWGGDDRVLNFSDVSEFTWPLGLPHLYWWSHHLHRPDWTWDNDRRISAEHGRPGLFHDIESFWYRESFAPTEPPQLAPLRHFEGIDWLTWHGEHTWLGFRSGFNGGNHDNDDLGTFVLGYDEERFLCDPGYRVNLASEHNCITVRDYEQTDYATARITQLAPLDGGFYLRCDIQEAFPLATARYNRHLLLIDDAHVLVIDDVLCRPAFRNYTRAYLQTRLQPEATSDGWRIAGEHATLQVRVLSESGFHRTDNWTHRRNRGQPIHRISWRDAHDRDHSVHVALLTFGDPKVDCTIDGSGVRLTVDAKHYDFSYKNKALVLEATSCAG
ncbi:MAG: hypothetical protein ACP5JG_02575 [Anaerolineae bacterium]